MGVHPGQPRATRFMGAVLVALWAALAVAIAAAYRPGGPLDLAVVVVCFLPPLVASASLARPPRLRTGRDRVILVWLWLAAFLLGAPLLYSVASSLAAEGPRTLVPSAEVGYAAFLALLSMCAFSLVGFADRPGRRALFDRAGAVRSATLALAAASGVALVFGGILLANDRNLPLDPSSTSRHGPTDPELLPPECDEPAALGPNASVQVEALASVDDVVLAEARLNGRRSGWDEAWSASWRQGPGAERSGAASAAPAPGGIAYRRIGSKAWLNLESDDLEAAGTTWLDVGPDPFDLVGAHGLTMDGPPQALVGSQRGRIVPEDVGLEVIEGARARHCRTFIDGPTALATFLPLRWLMAGDLVGLGPPLTAWRGELDWWVFADGQLGRSRVRVSGLASDAWPDPPGIRGELDATLLALDRPRPTDIGAPPG